MTPQDLISAFDTLAEAPDGVNRLRELVLQLAVRGKLVPQDPEDEPARVLLERASKEQTELIRAKAIRKKKMPPLAPSDHPFDIPEGWEWTRMWRSAHDLGQQVPTSPFSYVDVSAINKEKGSISGEVSVVEPEAAPSRARKKVSRGCVIYSTVRPYLRNIAVVDRNFYPAPIVSTAFSVLMPYAGMSSRFLYYYLRSPVFVEYVEAHQKGVAYPAINDGDFQVAPVPIPPLAEQHRIVARVDELMGLLDRLEAARTARDTTRAASRNAALAALREADTAEEVEVDWNRFAEHMDDLLCDPADIDPLRQAVRQLAVRGKLVPQDPEDEPASMLLERVERTDPVTVLSGQKPPRRKELPPVAPEEVPFGVPLGWMWVRSSTLTGHITKGTTPKKGLLLEQGDVPFLKVYNLTFDGTLNHRYKATFIDRKVHEVDLLRSKVIPGDVLMNIVGPPLGKVSIVPDDYPEWNINQAIAVFRSKGAITPRFMALCLLCSVALMEAAGLATRGTAGQDNVSLGQCRMMPIPLPPLAEQHRIVARVDELMGLLDRLQARLSSAQAAHGTFAAAAVHHLDA